MWIIRKKIGDQLKLWTTSKSIDTTNDSIVSEGGHETFYNGKTFIDCKRAVRLGDGLFMVKYISGSYIRRVYGNLWVAMLKGGKQVKLGGFEECEDELILGYGEDAERESMHYRGQFEKCEYIATWEELDEDRIP